MMLGEARPIDLMTEAFHGIRAIKAFSAEKYEKAQMDPAIRGLRILRQQAPLVAGDDRSDGRRPEHAGDHAGLRGDLHLPAGQPPGSQNPGPAAGVHGRRAALLQAVPLADDDEPEHAALGDGGPAHLYPARPQAADRRYARGGATSPKTGAKSVSTRSTWPTRSSSRGSRACAGRCAASPCASAAARPSPSSAPTAPANPPSSTSSAASTTPPRGDFL